MSSPNDDLGPMLAIAVSDAYGAGFEYAHEKVVEKHNDISGYIQNPKWKALQPGRYTDDTQMAMAIAEHMLEKAKWNPLYLAHRFVSTFHRDQRAGYAGGFYKFLQATTTGAGFLAGIVPHSDKSGGAMRAAPLGLYADTQRVIDLAMFQASLTHATKGGMDAAAAAALMTHYCYHDIGSLKDLPGWIDNVIPGWRFDQVWAGRVGSKGMDSVHAALTALTSHRSLSGCLQACIAFTGDVDTVAAIAMPAAAMSMEVANDLPMGLYANLEASEYGFDFLVTLDERLLEAFPTKCMLADLADAGKRATKSKREKVQEPQSKPLVELLADAPDDDAAGPLDWLFDDDA